MVAALLLAFGCSGAQVAPVPDPVLDIRELLFAEARVYGQEVRLDWVAELYPDLKPDVERLRREFKAGPYAAGYARIDALTASVESEQTGELEGFVATKKTFFASAPGVLREKRLTREEALQELLAVSRRNSGDFGRPNIAEALIAAHPLYRQNPSKEILAGHWVRVSTKDHPKAKGRDFSLLVPFSWKIEETKDETFVQMATSNLGRGPIRLFVQVNDINPSWLPPRGPITGPMANRALDELILTKLEGRTFVSGEVLNLNGQEWARVVTEGLDTDGPEGPRDHYERFTAVKHRHFISVVFHIHGRTNAEMRSLAAHYSAQFPKILEWAAFNDAAAFPDEPKVAFGSPSGPSPEERAWWNYQKNVLLSLATYLTLLPLGTTFWSLLGAFAGGAPQRDALMGMVQFVAAGLMPLTLWPYFRTRGIAGWKSLIPIHSGLLLLDQAGIRRRWLTLILIPLAGAWALHAAICVRLGKRHGLGWLGILTLVLMPGIGFLLLAKKATKDSDPKRQDNSDVIEKSL